jgi:hypothetical protein
MGGIAFIYLTPNSSPVARGTLIRKISGSNTSPVGAIYE